eukprot:gene14263-20236_t
MDTVRQRTRYAGNLRPDGEHGILSSVNKAPRDRTGTIPRLSCFQHLIAQDGKIVGLYADLALTPPPSPDYDDEAKFSSVNTLAGYIALGCAIKPCSPTPDTAVLVPFDEETTGASQGDTHWWYAPSSLVPDLITAVAHGDRAPALPRRQCARSNRSARFTLTPTEEPSGVRLGPPLSSVTILWYKGPVVKTASLCALYEVIRTDPKAFKNLIPSFTSILKQVFKKNRLHKTYDYHRYPAPFIQIKLLKILSSWRGVAFYETMYTCSYNKQSTESHHSHTIG